MITNKVQKLLVTNGTQAATVAALTAGQYVALVQGKANNTPIEAGDKFQLVIGKLNGTKNYSDLIKAKDIVSVRLEPYRAKVEQVATVTFTDPVEGLEYALNIIDKADKEVLQRRQDKRSYQYRAGNGDTAADVAAGFAAAINADEASAVTATSAAAVLTVTAKSTADIADAAGLYGEQHFFEVFSYEVDLQGFYVPYGTVAYTVNPDWGSGSYAQVKTIERETQGYEGYLNQTKFPVIQYPSDLSPAGTYDLIVISFNNQYSSNSVVFGDRVSDPIEIVIAVTAGATTALEALLANYIVD